MPKPLLKFRCYQCGKLLGVSPSKAGRTTACPSCKADLIVPDPTEPEEAGLDESIASITQIVENQPSPRVSESSRAPSHDPAFSWEEIDTALLQSGPAESVLIRSEPEIEVTPPALSPLNLTRSAPDDPAPILTEIAVEVAPVRSERTYPRNPSSQPLLTPGILASWSLFVFVAVGLAFVAGLLVGHFVWKGH